MNTFAYAASLLAKTQAAFALADYAGVQIPSSLSTSVAKLQSVVNVADGFELPNSTANDLADAERLLTSSLANDLPVDAKAKAAILDAISLVQNKGQFSASFSVPIGGGPASVVIQPGPIDAALHQPAE